MVRKLIGWGIDNPLIVIILAVALAAFGGYAFVKVNVEAYPDPAPAIVKVVAQAPGLSPELVERQVTIPLEVALAGMPGLKYTRTKSLFGLSHLRNQFEYGIDFELAKQEVINRLATTNLPNGWQPQISPQTPTGEIFRYVLLAPGRGRQQHLHPQRSQGPAKLGAGTRTAAHPAIAGVSSHGGTVRRYEIQPDPDRLRRYGITLAQLQAAISNSNATVGGDIITQGDVAVQVLLVGYIGGGQDPVNKVLGLKDPVKAAAILRAEERKRLKEIRQLVIGAVNNVPVRVEHIVAGGPVAAGEQVPLDRGVVVAWQTRMGRSSISTPREGHDDRGVYRLVDKKGNTVWRDVDEAVHAVVLLRKGEDTLPALHDVRKKINELNEPGSGKLLPGVKIEVYYDRTDLIHITTETVRENLLMGMALVVVILLMFLSNVRSALIVAVNIPLALLFAYAVLYARGKSANLLSMGAVDFGIIVDSSVIMVENIYRHISSGDQAGVALARPHPARLPRRRAGAVLLDDDYGVWLPAPVHHAGAGGANLRSHGADLRLRPGRCPAVGDAAGTRAVSAVFPTPSAGRRQHPGALHQARLPAAVVVVSRSPLAHGGGVPALAGRDGAGGRAWPGPRIHAAFGRGQRLRPRHFSAQRDPETSRRRRAPGTGHPAPYPQVEAVVPILGRPDDGTDPTGYYNAEIHVPLKLQRYWPANHPTTNWWQRLWHGKMRQPTKDELVKEMDAELSRKVPGVDWNFSQGIRDNVMEALSGVKGDNSVKIFGPDLGELERLGIQLRNALKGIRGMENVAVFNIQGQSNLEMRVDSDKCARYGVSTADVINVVQTALGSRGMSTMIEGEKLYDIAVRWPPALRSSETSILDIPVDVTNNTVAPLTGGPGTISAAGSTLALPAVGGYALSVANPLSLRPRVHCAIW